MGKDLGFSSLPTVQIFSWRGNWLYQFSITAKTNGHRLSILTQRSYITLYCVGQGFLGRLSCVLLRVSQGWHKVMGQLDSYLELLEENPLSSSFRCQQNSVPCRCGMEVLVSWLAVSQGLLFPLRSCPHSFSCGPFHLQTNKARPCPCALRLRSVLTSSTSWRKFSYFKGSCD